MNTNLEEDYVNIFDQFRYGNKYIIIKELF